MKTFQYTNNALHQQFSERNSSILIAEILRLSKYEHYHITRYINSTQIVHDYGEKPHAYILQDAEIESAKVELNQMSNAISSVYHTRCLKYI